MRIKFKLWFFLWFFVLLFSVNLNIVTASSDFGTWTHELTYDVEKVNISDEGTIKFEGWAFIDHLDNYGGQNLEISITALNVSNGRSYTLVNTDYTVYRNGGLDLFQFRCGNNCGNSDLENKKLVNAENNLYDYVCIYGVSSEYDNHLDGYSAGYHEDNSTCLYYNVGFSITFDIDDLVANLGEEATVEFYINARLKKYGISSSAIEGNCPHNGPWPCSEDNNGDISGATKAKYWLGRWWKSLPLGITGSSLYVNGSPYNDNVYNGANYTFSIDGMSDTLEVTYNGPPNLLGNGTFANKNNYFMTHTSGGCTASSLSNFVNCHTGNSYNTFLIANYNNYISSGRSCNNGISNRNSSVNFCVSTYDVYGVTDGSTYSGSTVIYPTRNRSATIYRVESTAVTVSGSSGLKLTIVPSGKKVSCQEKYGIGDVNVYGIPDLEGLTDSRTSISIGNINTTVNSAEYNQCTTKSISSGVNAYYKNGSCTATISVKTNILLHENGKMTIGNLYSITDGNEYNEIYAGGGFAIKPTSYESTLQWSYGIVSRNDSSKPSFAYELTAYSGCGSDFSISDILNNYGRNYFYSTSSYSGEPTTLFNVAKNNLNNYMNNTDDYKNFVGNLSEFTSSFNSNSGINDSADLEKIGIWTSTISGNLLPNSSYKIVNNFGFQDAYIKYSDVSVAYGDSYSTSTSYIQSGKLYYTSLKYRSDNYYVYFNNKAGTNPSALTTNSLSNIFQWYFSSRLSIGVQQTIYDEDSEGDDTSYEIDYSYRSVDVNKPFPLAFKEGLKSAFPQNWSDWYCGDGELNMICNSDNNNVTNSSRLKNTYFDYYESGRNPLYSVVLTENVRRNIRNITSSYDEFNVNSDGTTDFVSNSDNVTTDFNSGTSFCGAGIWNSSCDKY